MQYLVQAGDTLFTIAAKLYGDGNLWTRIRDANPGVDPNNLQLGQQLQIPDASPIPTPSPIPVGSSTYKLVGYFENWCTGTFYLSWCQIDVIKGVKPFSANV